LAERIAYLYRHPKLLASFGRQGIRRVNELFTWRKVAASIDALFEEVLASGHGDTRLPTRREAIVDESFQAAVAALTAARNQLHQPLLQAAQAIVDCFADGGKLLICGNGGSAAEAQHLSGELVGRFRLAGREALPAIALTADSAVLTAWSNDCGYEQVFARQVEALGRPGDVLLGLSTSGRSLNLLRAFETARRRSMKTIGLLGGDGGPLLTLADLAIVAPSADTQRIQEVHTVLVHLLCELIEEAVGNDAAERACAERAGAEPVPGLALAVPTLRTGELAVQDVRV
jgi:D-inositol-3-phosphate glycosyltransferase